jgi:3-oxoacyl-[acyl-carrier-protein] synthase II
MKIRLKREKSKSEKGNKMRRVVVTGLGAITPIGNTVEEFWNGIKENKCGIDNITAFDTTDYTVKLAGEVKNFHPEEILDPKASRRMDRYIQLAMVASKEAMKDSGLDASKIDANRFGVVIASGIGGMISISNAVKAIEHKGPSRVSPFAIPMAITNMAAGSVSIEVGAKGESYSIVTACASSTHALGECFRTIGNGYQDIMLVGGSEAAICEIGVAGFASMKALHTGTDKTRASIPFDKERSGFVMGEGAGILMLEELEHAKKRGAKIYAEIVGFGSTSDAYHITAPAPNGEGGARAMENAIKEAGINPEEINYINAHGTSTHLNDSGETSAVKKAFGNASQKVMISSTKSNTGHLLGAAGAVEAIVCIKAMEDGIIPATINYKVPDEECDLDIVPNENRKAEIKYAMSNSLGFGGHNSSIILKKFEE